MTLDAAAAIECNGCGDCCGSERSDGFWTWGTLPRGQHRSLNRGAPLVIPVEQIDGAWHDRPWVADDASSHSPTRFRCAALLRSPDGGGSCALHDAVRPSRCEDFPLGDEVRRTLAAEGEVWLQTGSMPRCSWYRVCVVAEDDVRRTT